MVADFNDLTTGNLQNQTGGSGLGGSWGDTGTINVVNSDLTAPSATNYAISQSGNALSVLGGHTEYRQSSRPLSCVPVSYQRASAVATGLCGDFSQ